MCCTMKLRRFISISLNQPSKILSVEVVELLVARQLEDNVFLLTDALVQRKIERGLPHL